MKQMTVGVCAIEQMGNCQLSALIKVVLFMGIMGGQERPAEA